MQVVLPDGREHVCDHVQIERASVERFGQSAPDELVLIKQHRVSQSGPVAAAAATAADCPTNAGARRVGRRHNSRAARNGDRVERRLGHTRTQVGAVVVRRKAHSARGASARERVKLAIRKCR